MRINLVVGTVILASGIAGAAVLGLRGQRSEVQSRNPHRIKTEAKRLVEDGNDILDDDVNDGVDIADDIADVIKREEDDAGPDVIHIPDIIISDEDDLPQDIPDVARL